GSAAGSGLRRERLELSCAQPATDSRAPGGIRSLPRAALQVAIGGTVGSHSFKLTQTMLDANWLPSVGIRALFFAPARMTHFSFEPRPSGSEIVHPLPDGRGS